MARKRKVRVRTITRRPKKRYSRRNSSTGVKMVQFDSMAYGALREKASNMLLPFTSKIPLGTIGDEIGMGLLNYLIAKKTSGFLKNVAMKGLVIENARVGEALINGQVGLGILGTTGQNQQSTQIVHS